MKNSKIEWCDHTINFFIGCQEVSPACQNCYARTQNEYRKWVDGWGPHGERRRTSAGNWQNIRIWNKAAEKSGVRARVFSNSLSDFFDNKADPAWRAEAWRYIEEAPWLDFLLLTKRPQNIAKMLPDQWGSGWPNVWLGATTENQDELNKNLGYLLYIPAKVHFISVEPMLGRVHLPAQDTYWHPLTWVINGGESGPKRRPMDLAWARSLRDQCSALDVPYFFKQVDKVQPIPPDLMVREFPAAASGISVAA